jgi:hypothetical protein
MTGLECEGLPSLSRSRLACGSDSEMKKTSSKSVARNPKQVRSSKIQMTRMECEGLSSLSRNRRVAPLPQGRQGHQGQERQ